jgi:hypothetical protein
MYLRVLMFGPVSIIPQRLYAHLHCNTALIWGSSRRSPVTFYSSSALTEIGNTGDKSTFTLFSYVRGLSRALRSLFRQFIEMQSPDDILFVFYLIMEW